MPFFLQCLLREMKSNMNLMQLLLVVLQALFLDCFSVVLVVRQQTKVVKVIQTICRLLGCFIFVI